MSDRPYNCPRCNAPVENNDELCDTCTASKITHQDATYSGMNIYMLLDGMRTAERYEREFTERLCQQDEDAIGPGERLALINLKLAAHESARTFIEVIARRAEAAERVAEKQP